MAHTYTQNLVHLIFSTKGRLPVIPNEKLQELWKYIVGIGANHKIHVIAVGGMRDHPHPVRSAEDNGLVRCCANHQS